MTEPEIEAAILKIKRAMNEINDLSKKLVDHHVEVRIDPSPIQVARIGEPVQGIVYWATIKRIM